MTHHMKPPHTEIVNAPETAVVKRCTKCKETKETTAFPRGICSKDGLSYWCRSCHAENNQKHKEKHKIYNAAYREKNRESIAAQQRTDTARSNARKYRLSIKGKIVSMLISARQRSKKFNVPFDLTANDISIPARCPVLDIPIVVAWAKKSRDDSASLDRIKPALGYVRGNVIVVSLKANRIKNDASMDELKRVYDFYSRLIL